MLYQLFSLAVFSADDGLENEELRERYGFPNERCFSILLTNI